MLDEAESRQRVGCRPKTAPASLAFSIAIFAPDLSTSSSGFCYKRINNNTATATITIATRSEEKTNSTSSRRHRLPQSDCDSHSLSVSFVRFFALASGSAQLVWPPLLFKLSITPAFMHFYSFSHYFLVPFISIFNIYGNICNRILTHFARLLWLSGHKVC